MSETLELLEQLKNHFQDKVTRYTTHKEQVIIEVPADALRAICYELRDLPQFQFKMLMDIVGIDYLTYGQDEWQTESATESGFSRGVSRQVSRAETINQPATRFALAYQLLSIHYQRRVQLKVYLEGDPPFIDSVIDIWASANWYEREAFDLFGILFKNHPDLRRILTDYGFIGYPFRKDFPLIGNVEMRYDATTERCIYEPVSIRPRTLVPKVIREDNRYLIAEEEGIMHG